MSKVVASSAYGPMLLSALEQRWPKAERIVDDPLAYRMLPGYMKLMVRACGWKLLRQALLNAVEKSTPGIRGAVLCRKRFIEDSLVAALGADLEAVVILGAGLDTLAYRLPQLAAKRVYEVDLPLNIAYKKRAVEALYGTVPGHVRLVPLDFEQQSLDDGLKAAGYTTGSKSFFVWEGVTQYLAEAAVRQTMAFLARAKPGSRLVFTYVAKDFIDGVNTYGLDRLYQRMRVDHQYWQFGLHPHEVAAFVGAYGWKVLAQVSADTYTERYLKPTGRTLAIAEAEPAVYAEKAG